MGLQKLIGEIVKEKIQKFEEENFSSDPPLLKRQTSQDQIIKIGNYLCPKLE